MRLIQICGFDSRTATAQTNHPPQNHPGFIDYEEAEAALFEEFVGPDGYARVLAADHARHYGEDICTPESIEELAGALFPRAADLLNQHGTRRAFSDRHLLEKVRQWARHFCESLKREHQEAAAAAKSKTNQQAHVHARYGGPEGVAKGNNHSLLKRTLQADDKAPEAKRMLAAGHTKKEVAQAFDRTPRTIYNWTKREIGAVATAVVERIQLAGGTVEEIVERLRRWKFAKGWSGTIHTLFDDGTGKAFTKFPLSDRSSPAPTAPARNHRDPARNHRDPAKLNAVAGICGLLRQHLARILLT